MQTETLHVATLTLRRRIAIPFWALRSTTATTNWGRYRRYTQPKVPR
jgi:hypothetical protein